MIPGAIPLAAPLAPALGAQAAAVGTLLLGSGAYLAEQLYGFRAPLPIPRVGGRAGEATLEELLADAIAGAQIGVGSLIPEPWQPPSGPAGALLAAAAAAQSLAQFWGYMNSRPGTVGPSQLPPQLRGRISGTLPPVGNTQPGNLVVSTSPGTYRADGVVNGVCFTNPQSPPTSWPGGILNPNPIPDVIKAQIYYEMGQCGPTTIGIEYYTSNSPNTRLRRPYFGSSDGFTEWTVNFTTSWSGTGAANYIEPTGDPLPYPAGWNSPDLIPEQASAPLVLPIPEPLPVGTTAEVSNATPVTQPATGTASAPVYWWQTTWTLEPAAGAAAAAATAAGLAAQPTTTATTTAGTLAPAAAAPVPVTDPTATFYGGAPYSAVGTAPQPTLAGIAAEVGRLEKKLGAMLDPTPNTAPEWWQLLKDLGIPLIQALMNSSDVGQYTLTDVCPPCGEEPQEFVFEWGGSPFALVNTNSRLEALALMIQKQKEIKQPLCKPCIIGQPVQVQFIQSELEWEPPP